MSTSVTSSGNFTRGCTQPADFSKGILNLFRLKGRTAIVTGAGQGIGFAAAHALAEAGANVAITYRTSKVADKSAKELADKYGVKCMSCYILLWLSFVDPRFANNVFFPFFYRPSILSRNPGQCAGRGDVPQDRRRLQRTFGHCHRQRRHSLEQRRHGGRSVGSLL